MSTPTHTHTVLHDPEGLIEAALPLDRGPHMSVAKAVLAWGPDAHLPPSDCEQIALLLTGFARAVASDVQLHCNKLPVSSRTRILTEVVLAEAVLQLSTPYEGTVRCVQQRAHMVKALYERLDRLAPPGEPPPA